MWISFINRKGAQLEPNFLLLFWSYISLLIISEQKTVEKKWNMISAKFVLHETEQRTSQKHIAWSLKFKWFYIYPFHYWLNPFHEI